MKRYISIVILTSLNLLTIESPCNIEHPTEINLVMPGFEYLSKLESSPYYLKEPDSDMCKLIIKTEGANITKIYTYNIKFKTLILVFEEMYDISVDKTACPDIVVNCDINTKSNYLFALNEFMNVYGYELHINNDNQLIVVNRKEKAQAINGE